MSEQYLILISIPIVLGFFIYSFMKLIDAMNKMEKSVIRLRDMHKKGPKS